MQIRNIQRRLGVEPEGMPPWRVPEKPKRMHLRTYDRLCRELSEHERKRGAILHAQLRHLLTRSDRILARSGTRSDNGA
jgi:hypothetical protein